MQRDPYTTEIDRAVGSEVAIRDGARALILPTIAEIGGRVRITAEVIDPHTQTTVYSETADGIGKESILPSLDTINSRLRVRLGEALATVSNESAPLEKVATGNLDALHLYSKAVKAQATGDIVQANIQLRSALRLDPGFGTARIELATNLLPLDERREMSEQLHLALGNADRLSARHTLYAEALLADLTSPRLAVEKWQALTTAYPDMFRAQGAYAFSLWQYANDFHLAIDVAKRNISEQNPNTGIGHYLLGTLLLGIEDYQGAIEHFGAAAERGAKMQNLMLASTYAAMRDFDRIEPALAAGTTHGGGARNIEESITRITFAIDRGNWKALDSLMATIDTNDRTVVPAGEQTLNDLKLAIATLFDTREKNKDLDYAPSKALQAEALGNKDFRSRSWNAHLLFRAWAAARSGRMETAEALLAQLGAEVRDPGFPTLNKLLLLTQSLLDFQNGNQDEALARLRSSIDGKELFATHITLMELLLQRGDHAGARDQARWLASHRGRAYAEATAGDMWLPFNVAQSNIALLVDAECSMHLRDEAQARKAMTEFKKRWPEQDLPAPLKQRSARLALQLETQATSSAVR
jgi:putative peptide modification system cyclase